MGAAAPVASVTVGLLAQQRVHGLNLLPGAAAHRLAYFATIAVVLAQFLLLDLAVAIGVTALESLKRAVDRCRDELRLGQFAVT